MTATHLATLRQRGPFLGLGLYWAWVVVVFYSDALIPFSPDAASLIDTIWLWATWSHMLALLAFAALSSRLTALFERGPLREIGTVGLVLGTASIPLISMLAPQGGSALILTIAIVMGAASSWHVLQWAQLYGRLATTELMAPSFLSFAGGLALYFVLVLFPAPILTATAALLPLFSSLAMGACRHLIPPQDTGAPNGHAPLPAQPFPLSEIALGVVAVFVFALCGELLRSFSLHIAGAGMNAMGQTYLVGGLVGLALLTACALLPAKAARTPRLTALVLRGALIAMAVAFLAAPFLGEYAAPVAYGIFGAGFWCFRAITWVLCFFVARAARTSIVRAVGVLDGTFALAVVASGQLNAWLAEAIKGGVAELTTISLIAVFVLMFVAMVVLNGPGLRSILDSDAGASSHDDTPEQRIVALFEQHGLSPREQEVAALLARGRSLPFIQDELYISAGTAQTHARHIYKKMGVHSRQELIDRVEEVVTI